MPDRKTICSDCLDKTEAYDNVNEGELKLVPKSKVCSFCIVICKHYDVWHHPHIAGMTHQICHKRQYWMAGAKCQSERKDCPYYEPLVRET